MYKHETIVKLFLPDDKSYKDSLIRGFSAPDFLADWKNQKKNFIRVDLTGEAEEDKKRFDFIRSEARRLKYTFDTLNILKIHFTNENTYGEFVRLVNIMTLDRIRRYMFYKDDFYILGEAPPHEKPVTETTGRLDL